MIIPISQLRQKKELIGSFSNEIRYLNFSTIQLTTYLAFKSSNLAS